MQAPLQQVLMYPLAEYDGTDEEHRLEHAAENAVEATSAGETKWVAPDTFFDVLPACSPTRRRFRGRKRVMRRCSRCSKLLESNPALKQPMIEAAAEVEEQVVNATLPVPKLRPAAATPLEHDLQRVCVRRRLLHTYRRGEVEYLRQFAAGNEVLLPGPRREGGAAQRCASLCRHLRKGPDPARQRLLVADVVQRRPLLRAKRRSAATPSGPRTRTCNSTRTGA